MRRVGRVGLLLGSLAIGGAVSAADDEGGLAVDEGPPPKERTPMALVFSEDFELRWWRSPKRLPGFEASNPRVLDWVEQVNRFTVGGSKDGWSFFAQVDEVALGGTTYFLDDTRRVERDLLAQGTWSLLIPGKFEPSSHGLKGWDLFSRNVFIVPEKLRVGWSGNDVDVNVGDTYASFGRGIALAIQRNVDIDVDTSLQGVEVVARPGRWDLRAVVGQLNRQQVFQDNPNVLMTGDRRHTVGGVSVVGYGLGPLNVGAHGVVYNFVSDVGVKKSFEELRQAPDVVVGGGTVEALGLGPTDWFVEVDGFAFPTADTWGGKDPRAGWALYASGAIYAGKATILVEGKRYFQTERVNSLLATEGYEAAIAPTLEYERSITEDSSAAMNSNDIGGARVRVDVTAIPGQLVPYAQIAVHRDLEVGGLHFNQVPETIVHPMVGVELTHPKGWSVLGNVGYRADVRDGDDAGADRHLHGDVLAKLPIAKGFAFDLSLSGEWFGWGKNPVQQADYREIESSFALAYKSLVTLTWYTDYSTNPLIDSVGNLTPSLYGAGEIQVHPIPELTIRAFYGAYKSGVRCAGGQCRRLPGFDGARVSLTATF